jgi:SNF2 family DNA or RNA helicase
VLREHDGPAVIWCRFTDDIKDIESFLKENDHTCVTYFGETSQAERATNIWKFRTGEAQYFISNPDAGGTGLDGLQDVAELAVYYSNSFKAESRWQSEDRLHRLGMRGRCHIVDLVAPGTVDELLLKNLKEKSDLARAVFNNPSLLDVEGRREAA